MDHPRVNRISALQLTLLSIGVCVSLVPVTTSYEWLATFAFLFGFLDGCYVISQPLVVQSLVASQKLASAFGSMYFFFGGPVVAGPSIAGWIYDSSNSYTVAFLCAGGVTIIATCILCLVPLFQANSSPEQKPREVVVVKTTVQDETTL